MIKQGMSGLYVIRNQITCKEYIGITQNFAVRFKRHRYELRHKRHHCLHLQRAWDKYGEENFEFLIVKECTYSEAAAIEQERLSSLSGLYNVSQHSQGGDLISTHPNREDIVEKMRLSLIKRFAAMSLAERRERYGRPGMKNGMYGRHHTAEAKAKMSVRFKGKGGSNHHNFGIRRSEATRRKMSIIASKRVGESNPFYGRQHSSEAKARIAAKNRGKKPKNMRSVLVSGRIYPSVTEAAAQLNISPALVIYRIKSAKYDYCYQGEDVK